MKPLVTRWGRELDRRCPLNDYPRPQLRRDNWMCLNGVWQYAICDAPAGEPQAYGGEIIVPFSPESLLSGVGRQLKPGQRLWYRRTVRFDGPQSGQRILLHFGAVDQYCTVYMNSREVGGHSGGYWPFSFDITDAVCEGENTLTVSVADDSDMGNEAYGKQKLNRGGIWYTAQSGIWQTVWAEYVPQQYLQSIKITPHCGESEVEFELKLSPGATRQPSSRIQVFEGSTLKAEKSFEGTSTSIKLGDFLSWSPDDPFLYDVKIFTGNDAVESYFAMREFGTVRDECGHLRLSLNGKPLFHTGLLDQGYWSDGLYTAPGDEAMVWELARLKEMGFNMLRKHIKIEPMRWYYHCDRLGMIVWQDFVNGGGPYRPMMAVTLPFIGFHLRDSRYGRFGRQSADGRAVYLRDMQRTVELLYNAACIAVWVPFNEGWGQFDACRIAGEVQKLDPTRLVDHASGWHDQGCGDFYSRHIYYKRFRLMPDRKGRVQALTEFGGYSCPQEGHMASEELFGYRMYRTREELSAAFDKLYRTEILPAVENGLAAAIYTQVSDVEDEINGVFTYDRETVKIDPDIAASINRELRILGG